MLACQVRHYLVTAEFFFLKIQETCTLTTFVEQKLSLCVTGKNNGFPILDIFGYLKNTHKNPKFGRVRQIPIREFPTKIPNWDFSHSPKFGIFVGVLLIPKNIQNRESVIFSCVSRNSCECT